MNQPVFVLLAACVVCMSFFNLAACLLFIRISGQVNRSSAARNNPSLRRKSVRRVQQTFSLHRELYPASRIRLAATALMGSALFAFLLLMALLFLNAPRSTGASSSPTTQSPR